VPILALPIFAAIVLVPYLIARTAWRVTPTHFSRKLWLVAVPIGLAVLATGAMVIDGVGGDWVPSDILLGWLLGVWSGSRRHRQRVASS